MGISKRAHVFLGVDYYRWMQNYRQAPKYRGAVSRETPNLKLVITVCDDLVSCVLKVIDVSLPKSKKYPVHTIKSQSQCYSPIENLLLYFYCVLLILKINHYWQSGHSFLIYEWIRHWCSRPDYIDSNNEEYGTQSRLIYVILSLSNRVSVYIDVNTHF